jgi:hypothetical protein
VKKAVIQALEKWAERDTPSTPYGNGVLGFGESDELVDVWCSDGRV